ncbi:MAG: exodeoxyribonuclease VII small subunit [Lachnospiraceae bacterium]|nr:exodeoxyribonuclease VII small subunit [Lachnospiraceae bacterium]
MTDIRNQSGIDVLSFDADREESQDQSVREEKKNRKPTLEEMLEMIDEISSEMEEGNLSLEDSFRRYRQGMELVKRCAREIASVEKQIQVLDEHGDLDDF